MNTEQLLGLVRRLVQDDQRLALQQKLTEAAQSFANLASNPQAQQHQTEVSDKLKQLEQALSKLETSYSPAFRIRLEIIGALPYFSTAMTARLRQSMNDNPMSPAVVNQEAQKLVAERQNYLNNLTNLRGSLDALGFELDELQPGQAEVGFQIPRAIFDNDLDGFARELHELRLIIRAFSEAAGNTGESIELRQISTTDPLVFVMLGYGTVKLLGQGASWCLDQWKKLEEIRNIRATTANLKGVPDAKSLAERFDTLIQETLEANVRKEAERLASESGSPGPRQNELANHLGMALQGMLARIERGMTVEIRFLPPAKATEGEADTAADGPAADFEELKKLQQQLVFPAPADEPLLKLPKQPEEASQKKGHGKDDGAVAPA
jgi:hypothetical protein